MSDNTIMNDELQIITPEMNKILDTGINILENQIHEFYKPNPTLHQHMIKNIKVLYDLCKSNSMIETEGIEELLTDGFDEEQIWSQIQDHLQPLIEHLNKQISKFEEKEEIEMINEIESDSEKEEPTDDEEVQDEESKIEMNKANGIITQDDGDIKPEENRAFLYGDDGKYKPEPIPEDINKFIEQMEVDLDKLEEDYEKGLDKEQTRMIYGEELDDEDLLEEDLDDDDDEGFDILKPENEMIVEGTEDDLKFPDELEGDELGRDEEEGDELEEEEEEGEGEEEEEKKEEIKLPKTEFEKHEEKMLESIEQLEEQNVAEKPWQESGEVFGFKRPKNSLLTEDLTFKHAAKAKPIITEEVTQDLEAIIIHRIVSGIFDDPQRPDLEEKKLVEKVELKAEKSQKSLAEIYEEEYLRRVEGIEIQEENPEIKKKKDYIRQKVQKLVYTLNLMSNLSYVPEPVAPDVKPNKNIPSISMEEKIPVTVSDETLLAPEEIMKPIKSIPVGESELTKEDRKKKRKRIKEAQSKKAKKAKALADNIDLAKASKEHKTKLKESLQDKEEKSNIGYTKSKQFFAHLQENLSKFDKDARKKEKEDKVSAEAKKVYSQRL